MNVFSVMLLELCEAYNFQSIDAFTDKAELVHTTDNILILEQFFCVCHRNDIKRGAVT